MFSLNIYIYIYIYLEDRLVTIVGALTSRLHMTLFDWLLLKACQTVQGYYMLEG